MAAPCDSAEHLLVRTGARSVDHRRAHRRTGRAGLEDSGAVVVLSSVLTGLTFFTVGWSGQHALRSIRVDLFKQLHRCRWATTARMTRAT